METIHQQFIDDITARCNAVNVHPATICTIAGRTSATWYNWRNGKHSPTAEDMQAMIEAVAAYKVAHSTKAKRRVA